MKGCVSSMFYWRGRGAYDVMRTNRKELTLVWGSMAMIPTLLMASNRISGYFGSVVCFSLYKTGEVKTRTSKHWVFIP